MIFDLKIWHFLTPPHYTNSIISFGDVDFQANIFQILYPLLENSTTRITICIKYFLQIQILAPNLISICFADLKLIWVISQQKQIFVK